MSLKDNNTENVDVSELEFLRQRNMELETQIVTLKKQNWDLDTAAIRIRIAYEELVKQLASQRTL